MNIGETKLHKEDEPSSWFRRLKQYLQFEPQNKDDLIALLRDAHIRTLIDTETLTMIEGVIHFSELQVRDIMIPRNQMVVIHEDIALNDIILIVAQSGHSRFPVYGENKDEIIGILHAKDLLKYQPPNPILFDLHDILRQVTFVPESKYLDKLLSEFKTNRNHMAIVVDEYGEISGFVTIEDIIEQIIGDIEDEFDIDEDAYIKLHNDNHYILKAHTPIDEFNQTLHTNYSDDSYDTIGGIIMNAFGYLPKKGEAITLEGLEFKVLNADARRIKLLECIDSRSHVDTPITGAL